LLSLKDKLLKETAEWIVAHHPDWGGQLTELFRERLRAPGAFAERNELSTQLAQFAANPAIQKLIADECTQPVSEQERLVVLQTMAKGAPLPSRALWRTPLSAALQ